MKKTELEQTFLENANEAASRSREIYHIFGGYGDESSPEDGLLGKVYDCVAEMISVYLEPITGKELHSDELNDITWEIMHMDKEGIGDLIKNIVMQLYKVNCVDCLIYRQSMIIGR